MTDEHGLPDHGTASRYNHHGCRCDLCRAEKNRLARESGSNRRVGRRGEQKRAQDAKRGGRS